MYVGCMLHFLNDSCFALTWSEDGTHLVVWITPNLYGSRVVLLVHGSGNEGTKLQVSVRSGSAQTQGQNEGQGADSQSRVGPGGWDHIVQ